MAVRILFCLFLFIPLAKQHATQEMLNDVVSSLEHIVGFFQSDYKNLNLDGLFGLRVLEGHLGAVIQKHANGELKHLSGSVIGRIQTLKNKTSHICSNAIEDVKKDDVEYFQKMSYVVGGPWEVFDSIRKRIDPNQIWSDVIYENTKAAGVKVNEKTSDRCMWELMGSHKANGRPCDISDKCASVMTHPGLLGYGITHQILWTMLAEKAGCKSQLEAKFSQIQRGTVQSVRLELCTNNYIQLIDTLSKMNGVVMSDLQDLFLEQLFICPSLGFYEFLDIDYLPQIRSWQDDSGCFGEEATHSKDTVLHVPNYNNKGRSRHDFPINNNALFENVKDINLQGVMNGIHGNVNGQLGQMPHNNMAVKMEQLAHNENMKRWDTPRHASRRLLIEKEMSNGCLSHKTAVASGALVMYLRFLCEPDAALIFNKSSSLHTNMGLASYGVHKPVQIVVKPSAMVVAGPLDAKLKQSGNINDAKSIDSNVKQLKVEPEVKDSVNSSVKGVLSNRGKLHDMGKRYLHKENIGNQHFDNNLHQIQAPQFHGKLNNLLLPPDNVRQGINHDNEVNGDIGNEDNDDDEDADYADDDDDEEEKEDGYDYDHENEKPDPNIDNYGADFPGHKNQKHEILNPGHYQDINDNNDNDDNDKLDDNYDAVDDDEDDDDDGDYDGDYVDNKEEEVAHPHINARNIGHNKNQNYDHPGYDQYEKSINHDKDYEYDDEEEEDDYEYDDENDVIQNKRQESFKQEIEKIDTPKKIVKSQEKHPDPHISNNVLSQKYAIFVIFTCFILTLFFMYRFIRKRRIRIRFSPKYFHV